MSDDLTVYFREYVENHGWKMLLMNNKNLPVSFIENNYKNLKQYWHLLLLQEEIIKLSEEFIYDYINDLDECDISQILVSYKLSGWFLDQIKHRFTEDHWELLLNEQQHVPDWHERNKDKLKPIIYTLKNFSLERSELYNMGRSIQYMVLKDIVFDQPNQLYKSMITEFTSAQELERHRELNEDLFNECKLIADKSKTNESLYLEKIASNKVIFTTDRDKLNYLLATWYLKNKN